MLFLELQWLEGSHVIVQLRFIVQSHHVCGASCGDHALVCCVSFPFILRFGVHGGTELFKLHFTSVGL